MKHTTKAFFSQLLALLMCISLFPASALAEEPENGALNDEERFPVLSLELNGSTFDYGERVTATAWIAWPDGSTEDLDEAYLAGKFRLTFCDAGGNPVPDFIVQSGDGQSIECNFPLFNDELSAGVYTIKAEKDCGSTTLRAERQFTYTAEHPEPVDYSNCRIELTIEPEVVSSGHVYLRVLVTDENGDPVENVMVDFYLLDPAGNNAWDEYDAIYNSTHEDGRCSLTLLFDETEAPYVYTVIAEIDGTQVRDEGSLRVIRPISEESFPDPIFRAYVSEHFDGDGDGILSYEEVSAVKVIDLGCSGVASLQGLAFFPELEELHAGGDFTAAGALSSVDLSANTRLRILDLGFDPLTELDVSMLESLESLNVGFCGLSELDLSWNPFLRLLWCNDNALSTLDLSANSNLEHLDCCGNEKLTELDLRPCPVLAEAYRAGGRHLSWMQEIMPEKYESILVYGGTGDEDYALALNTWMSVRYDESVSFSVSYYYSDTGFESGYSGDAVEGNQLKMTAKAREGYRFLGWYLASAWDEAGLPTAYGELLCESFEYTFTITKNVSLVAVYEKENADVIPGDLNGDNETNAQDLMQLRIFLVGLSTESTPNLVAADLNGDGSIDILDLVLLRKLLV